MEQNLLIRLLEWMFQAIWAITPGVTISVLLLLCAAKVLGKRLGYGWMWICLNLMILISVFPTIYANARMDRFLVSIPSVIHWESDGVEDAVSVPLSTQTEELVSGNQEINVTVSDGADLKEREEFLGVSSQPPEEMASGFRFSLFSIWLMGALLFLMYHIIQYARMTVYLRRGRERIKDPEILDQYAMIFSQYQKRWKKQDWERPAIYYHRGLPSSLCVGLIRQEIYIDSQDRDMRDTKWILCHELVHAIRGDLSSKVGMLILQTLHWFNPFVHLYVRKMDQIIEMGCDEEVVRDLSEEEKKNYCMTILNSIREGNRKRSRMSTAFMENKKTLKNRLEHIMDVKPKKKTRFLELALVIMIFFAVNLVGCQKMEEPQQTEQTDLISKLYSAQTDYIGNASAVGKILGLLPLPEYLAFHDEGMELFTDETAPMGVNRHLTFVGTISSEIDDAAFERNAYLFLALVNNADFVEYTIHGEENAVLVTYRYDRKMAEEYYGDTDLRSFTADPQTFRTFVEELSQLFDSPLTEDAFAETSATWEENQRQAGQYIATLAELPMEGDFTSWAEKIRQQPEFDALCKLGDDTLIYCLSHFAVYAGEDTESMVMMLAADQIAFGEKDPAELAQTTPAQWYSFYNALDSVYLGSFYKGMEKQYAAMPQTSYLSLSKEAAASTVISKNSDVQAVYEALSSLYEQEAGDGHRMTIFAPLILDISKSENWMTVSCVVHTREYCLMRVKEKGYCMKQISGSSVPASLFFTKEEGGWNISDVRWAKDGSQYEPSIKAMAPNDVVAQRMMSYDSDEITRLLYENMISYLEIVGVTQNGPYIYDGSYMEPDTKTEISKFLRLA
ncbi:DUF4825 domain-containing protein [Anaerotignum lactatifermentans]|uniref:DUF4825 domain-containing protein n=1 Tax=Anaerotignum lactatifermentans TaxID=160404 RepID=A0ABS2GAI9_9FIRM|nr:M56 family metallopeptidase [Anaerotignum lactatifermentans]MBM6828352.1 DUF4825 domain-containing protein [Anaerotignum lactatifermentans]MBM6877632.1 DUF4825 domain-containing protein [Anaerotignum lactatifermentans]MBM6949935.1 DUF4825 domain-containing protein [Anaerotignum lactatifermentans]